MHLLYHRSRMHFLQPMTREMLRASAEVAARERKLKALTIAVKQIYQMVVLEAQSGRTEFFMHEASISLDARVGASLVEIAEELRSVFPDMEIRVQEERKESHVQMAPGILMKWE